MAKHFVTREAYNKCLFRLRTYRNITEEFRERWRNSRAEKRELEATLKLIRDSDQRAIRMWQAAHPGSELIWPDRGKMIFWLLEQLDKKGDSGDRNQAGAQ
jgi:hypothetical protein